MNEYFPLTVQLIVGFFGTLLSAKNLVPIIKGAKFCYIVVWILLTVSFLSLFVFGVLGATIPHSLYLVMFLGVCYLLVYGSSSITDPVPRDQKRHWSSTERSRAGAILFALVPTAIVAHDMWFVVPDVPVRIVSFKLVTPVIKQGEPAIVEIKGEKLDLECRTEVRNLWFKKETKELIAETNYSTGFLKPGPFSVKVPRPTEGYDSRSLWFALPPGEVYLQTKLEFLCDDTRRSYWSPILTLTIEPDEHLREAPIGDRPNTPRD